MRTLVESKWCRVSCDVCGGRQDEQTLLGESTGRIAQRRQDYVWRHEDVQCNHCGFIFNRIRPAPTFLRDYYADCWPIASDNVVIEPDFDVEARLRVLRRWLRSGARVYEIGDKLGESHSALAEEGYRVMGDDVMAQTVGRNEWLAGLFDPSRKIEPPDALRMNFDAVLAYFVVEHLANPLHWLCCLKDCLKLRGYLVIEVPHFQLHPKEALMHEHFLYLTPAHLSRLVIKAGYDVVEILEDGASRDFGFSLVARRAEGEVLGSCPEGSTAAADCLRLSYQRGREAIEATLGNLLHTAQIVAAAIRESLSQGEPVQVCFFGANQTATEIVGHLYAVLADYDAAVAPLLRIFDNSNVKHGVRFAGFEKAVEKPAADIFQDGVQYLWIICSRGWVQEIAEQIRSFRQARFLILDGSTAKELS